jgi:hypothetical protein
MTPLAVEQSAAALLRGEWPDARTADLLLAVRRIADTITAHADAPAIAAARRACGVLNKQRRFEHTRLIAQAWLDRHGFDATVQRMLSQALVNLGGVDEAEQLVQEGLARARAPGASAQAQSELSEFEGLQGRILKQRFVQTEDLDQLVMATNHYLSRYENLPTHPHWHGVNAVALRAREERAGLVSPGGVSAAKLAARVCKQAKQAYKDKPSDHWAAATVSETCLAMDDCDGAELWLRRFIEHPEAGPFDLDSYSRQLQEIWQGSPVGGTSCADLLATLIARHLERDQARLTVSAPQVQALRADLQGLEKNFSGEIGFSVRDVKALLARCASIGCVTIVSGVRLGTGFLVRGVSLKAGYGEAPVLLTNAHVLPDVVPLDGARVSFELESEAAGKPVSYPVGELLFTSPPDKLDVSIVRLEGLPPKMPPLELAAQLPLIDAKSRAYVVGHPQGGGLQISLHDSELIDVDDEERLLHYRTPTDPGSSGSPVFNSRWEVIALHHSGSSKTRKLHGEGTYEANEGIVIGAIREALNA